MVADAVMMIAVLTVVSELLGSVGLFRRWIVAAACLIGGAVASRWARRTAVSHRDSDQLARPQFPPSARLPTAIALAMVTIVVSHWVSASLAQFHHGMSDIDSLAYHAPFAARFVQAGWITRLQFASGNATFYPANGELVQALAMLPFHRDLLSPFVNLGWLALALLAAWCAGRPFNAAPSTLAGVAVVVSSPLLVWFGAGTAGNDIMTLALTLAVVALLVNSRWRPAEVALAGAATGLAMGTKLNVVAPLGLLVVALPAVIPRARRWARAGLCVLSAVLLGSFWYVRNVVKTGNPLPWARFGVGPLALPALRHPDTGQLLGVPLIRYGRERGHWHELSVGLNDGFGRAWLLVLLLAAAGLVTAMATGARPVHRLLGGFGASVVLIYLITPNSAGGIGLVPGFFAINLRYLAPALATGVVLLALVPVLSGTRAQALLLSLFAVVLVVTTWGSGTGSPDRPVPTRSGLIPGSGSVRPVIEALAVGTVLLSMLAVTNHRSTRFDRSLGRIATAVVVAVALSVGWIVQRRYFETRYLKRPLPSTIFAADRWAQHVSHQRIAVAGQLLYPLFGASLSNRVVAPRLYLGRGDTAEISTCIAWRHALAAERYDYVVVRTGGIGFSRPKELDWTRTVPGATEVLHNPAAWVFRLPARVSGDRCP